jgi:hypothetical protein
MPRVEDVVCGIQCLYSRQNKAAGKVLYYRCINEEKGKKKILGNYYMGQAERQKRNYSPPRI